MNRPTWAEYFMSIAFLVADRANCVRRQIGAVIVKDNRILATGYNGTAAGRINCYEGGCVRCNDPGVESGKGLDQCVCLHAETNAVLQAANCGTSISGSEIFITHLPCFTCAKNLVGSGIRKVTYKEDYPGPVYPGNSKEYLINCGIEVAKV